MGMAKISKWPGYIVLANPLPIFILEFPKDKLCTGSFKESGLIKEI
jgi:hypothetical protein